MKRKQVKSTNLRAIGYDPDKKHLEVEFQTGVVYRYFDVPNKVYSSLIEADSVGKYFWSNIREKYEYERVE